VFKCDRVNFLIYYKQKNFSYKHTYTRQWLKKLKLARPQPKSRNRLSTTFLIQTYLAIVSSGSRSRQIKRAGLILLTSSTATRLRLCKFLQNKSPRLALIRQMSTSTPRRPRFAVTRTKHFPSLTLTVREMLRLKVRPVVPPRKSLKRTRLVPMAKLFL